MEFIEGSSPDVNELQSNMNLVYEWGKLTGKMHKAAKEYPIWKNVSESDERFGLSSLEYFSNIVGYFCIR